MKGRSRRPTEAPPEPHRPISASRKPAARPPACRCSASATVRPNGSARERRRRAPPMRTAAAAAIPRPTHLGDPGQRHRQPPRRRIRAGLGGRDLHRRGRLLSCRRRTATPTATAPPRKASSSSPADAPSVAVGDHVEVAGTVAEILRASPSSPTSPTSSPLSSGNMQPTSAEIALSPDFVDRSRAVRGHGDHADERHGRSADRHRELRPRPLRRDHGFGRNAGPADADLRPDHAARRDPRAAAGQRSTTG